MENGSNIEDSRDEPCSSMTRNGETAVSDNGNPETTDNREKNIVESQCGDSSGSVVNMSSFYDAKEQFVSELSSYKKRIDTTASHHQDQALLIATLENKVLDYRRRCAELQERIDQQVAGESRLNLSSEDMILSVNEFSPQTSTPMRHDQDTSDKSLVVSFDNVEADVFIALEAEKQRVITQQELSTMYREQLDSVSKINESLMYDIQKVNLEHERMKKDYMLKEQRWRERDKALKGHFTEEHRRLLTIWSALQNLKHLHMDLRSATERDMATLKTYLYTTYKRLVSECQKLGFSHLAQALVECRESGSPIELLLKFDSGAMDPVLVKKLKKLVDSQHEITACKDLMKEEMTKLASDNQELQSKLEGKELEVEQVTDELRKTQRELQNKKKLHQKSVLLLESNCSEFQRKKEAAESLSQGIRTKLQEELMESRCEAERLNKKVHSLEQSSLKLQGVNEELELKFTNLNKKFTDFTATRKNLTAETDVLKELLKKAQEELDSTRTCLQRMEGQAKEAELQVQKLTSDLQWVQEDKVKELETLRKKMELNIQTVQNEKMTSDAELESLHKRFQTSEESKKSLELKLVGVESELLDIREGKKAAQEKLSVAQGLISSQEESLKIRAEEAKQLKTKLSQAESQCRQKDMQIKDIMEQVKSVTSQRDAIEVEKNNMKDIEASWEREKTNHAALKKLYDSEVETLCTRISNMEQQKKAVELQYRETSEQVKQCEDEVSGLKMTVERLKSTLSRSEETEQRLKAQIDVLNNQSLSEKQDLTEQLSASQRELSVSKGAKERLEKELRAAMAAAQDWKNRTGQSILEVKKSEKELFQSREAKAQLESKIGVLTKSLKTLDMSEQELRNQLKTAEGEKKELKARARQLKQELEKLKSQKEDLTAKNDRWEREKSSLYQTIDELRDENEKAELSIRATADERQAVDKSLTALEKENLSLHKELQKLKTQIAFLENDQAKKLTDSIHALRKEHERRIQQMSLEKQQLLSSLERYRSRCKGLEEQKKALSDQLEEANRRKENFVTNSRKHDEEVSRIRNDLNRSLQNTSLFMDSMLFHGVSAANSRDNSKLLVPNSADKPLATSSPFVTPIKKQ